MAGNSFPLFATVRFAHPGDALSGLSGTFRVPLTPETTVRRLAKDAMQRLALSRHRSGHKKASSIMVTEVYVGGEGEGENETEKQPRAEVFAQDIVTQVVHIKDEVIHMTIQTYDELEALRTAQAGAVPALPAQSSSCSHCTTPVTERVRAPSGRCAPADPSAVPVALQNAAIALAGHRPEHVPNADGVDVRRSSEQTGMMGGACESVSLPSAVSAAVAEEVSTPAGKGMGEEQRHTDTTLSTTVIAVRREVCEEKDADATSVTARPRRVTRTVEQESCSIDGATKCYTASSASAATSSTSMAQKSTERVTAIQKSATLAKRPRTNAVVVGDEVEEDEKGNRALMNKKKRCTEVKRIAAAAEDLTPDEKSGRASGRNGDTINRLRAQEMSRLRWGPEAHKHFATNYVSSPEKLMRKCFTRRKSEQPSQLKQEPAKQEQPAQETKPLEGKGKDATGKSHSTHAVLGGADKKPKPHTPAFSINTTANMTETEDVEVQLPKGWGPDAARCFPLNYVSSPDKLARQIRERHRQEKKEKELTAARERAHMEEEAKRHCLQKAGHSMEVTCAESVQSNSTGSSNSCDQAKCTTAATGTSLSATNADDDMGATAPAYEVTGQTVPSSQTRSVVARQLHFADLYDNTQDDGDGRGTTKDVSPESRPTMPHVTALCADNDSATDIGAMLAKTVHRRDKTDDDVEETTSSQPWLAMPSQNVFGETDEGSFTFTL